MDRYRMLPSYRYYDVEGTSPLTLDKSVGKPLRDYKIYGNSVQDGTPSPENPIEIQSCGDKSKNLLDISSLVHYDNSSNGRTTKTDNNLVVHSSESQTYVYIPSDKSKKGLFDRLKPSTTYRLKYSSRYLEGEPTPSQSRIIFVNSSFVAKLIFYIAKPITVGQIVTINTTFKTPADMSEYDQILIYGAYGNGSRTEIIDWIVTEETETVEPYEPYGYKIPIEVGGTVTNIYLDEPLKNGEYIDFINQRLVKSDTEQPIDLPPILTHKGTNIISVGTEIPPSNMQIQYYK